LNELALALGFNSKLIIFQLFATTPLAVIIVPQIKRGAFGQFLNNCTR
jgi:hypothetical protein